MHCDACRSDISICCRLMSLRVAASPPSIRTHASTTPSTVPLSKFRVSDRMGALWNSSNISNVVLPCLGCRVLFDFIYAGVGSIFLLLRLRSCLQCMRIVIRACRTPSMAPKCLTIHNVSGQRSKGCPLESELSLQRCNAVCLLCDIGRCGILLQVCACLALFPFLTP